MSNSEVTLVNVTLDTPANFFDDEEAVNLFTYWLSCSKDGALPLWKDFNLVDMPTVVPNIALLEVVGDPPTFVTIMTGTTVVREIGQDNTSAELHELEGAADVSARLEMAVKTGQGYLLSNAPVSWASHDYKKHAALMLPLANAEGRVSHIVGWVGDFV